MINININELIYQILLNKICIIFTYEKKIITFNFIYISMHFIILKFLKIILINLYYLIYIFIFIVNNYYKNKYEYKYLYLFKCFIL